MMDNRLKVETAQQSLSDLGRGKHIRMPTPRRKIPFFDIRFSTDREPGVTLRSAERVVHRKLTSSLEC
jgi:hypothetical protein